MRACVPVNARTSACELDVRGRVRSGKQGAAVAGGGWGAVCRAQGTDAAVHGPGLLSNGRHVFRICYLHMFDLIRTFKRWRMCMHARENKTAVMRARRQAAALCDRRFEALCSGTNSSTLVAVQPPP